MGMQGQMVISAFRVGRDGTEDGLPAAGSVRYRDAGKAWPDCARTSLLVGDWSQGTAGAVHPYCRRWSIAPRAAYRLAPDDGADGSLHSHTRPHGAARVESVLSLNCLSIRRCPATEPTAGRRGLHRPSVGAEFCPTYY